LLVPYPPPSHVITSGKQNNEKIWAEPKAKLDEKFGRKRRIGWEAIKYLTSKEIPVKLFFAKSDDNDIKNYSLNLESEQKDNKERYKICLIGKLLCLDIDRKNGIDGIASFYDYFKKRGVEKERLPLYLQNIDKGSYPFYMSTPSGGLHLYFKYLGKCPDGKLCDGVEIKNKQLSGGYKDDKPYVLHGDIEDMQRIPPILLKEIIPKPKQVKQERIFSAAQKYKSESKREFPSWSKITEYTDEDGKGTQGRNSRAFSLALHARTHGYDINETLENLMQDQSVNELPQKELSDVVKSAYKKA
jgi:hypothetical protein